MADRKRLIPEVKDPVLTIKLRKPVLIGDEVLEEVNLREPVGLDVINAGNPVKFDGFSDQYQVDFDMVKVVKMLCMLSNGLPRVAFERMHPNDLADCCWAIAPFFVPWVNRSSVREPTSSIQTEPDPSTNS